MTVVRGMWRARGRGKAGLMKLWRLLPVLGGLLTLVPSAGALAQAGAPPDSVKRTEIRRLLVIQRTDSVLLVGLAQAMALEKPDPNLPPAFMQEFAARARRDIGEFLERVVPVYDSLYTLDDVRQLIAFYETPLGQRVLETQPRLMEALAALGQQWGIEIAAQVLLDLARRGEIKP